MVLTMNRYLLFFVMLILALLLTISTFLYQRPSQELIKSGTECSVEYWMHCYTIRKSAGFPLAYVFDSPGVSIENKLGVEDDFRLLPFVTNIWLFLILLMFTRQVFKKEK